MRNPPAGYKHDNPIYHSFSKSGDGALLRKGYAKGGAVEGQTGRKCVAEDGSVGDCASDDWKNESNEAMSDRLAGPKTQAIFDAEAADRRAVGEALSNMNWPTNTRI